MTKIARGALQRQLAIALRDQVTEAVAGRRTLPRARIDGLPQGVLRTAAVDLGRGVRGPLAVDDLIDHAMRLSMDVLARAQVQANTPIDGVILARVIELNAEVGGALLQVYGQLTGPTAEPPRSGGTRRATGPILIVPDEFGEHDLGAVSQRHAQAFLSDKFPRIDFGALLDQARDDIDNHDGRRQGEPRFATLQVADDGSGALHVVGQFRSQGAEFDWYGVFELRGASFRLVDTGAD